MASPEGGSSVFSFSFGMNRNLLSGLQLVSGTNKALFPSQVKYRFIPSVPSEQVVASVSWKDLRDFFFYLFAQNNIIATWSVLREKNIDSHQLKSCPVMFLSIWNSNPSDHPIHFQSIQRYDLCHGPHLQRIMGQGLNGVSRILVG